MLIFQGCSLYANEIPTPAGKRISRDFHDSVLSKTIAFRRIFTFSIGTLTSTYLLSKNYKLITMHLDIIMCIILYSGFHDLMFEVEKDMLNYYYTFFQELQFSLKESLLLEKQIP
jgi:hypothetical protein